MKILLNVINFDLEHIAAPCALYSLIRDSCLIKYLINLLDIICSGQLYLSWSTGKTPQNVLSDKASLEDPFNCWNELRQICMSNGKGQGEIKRNRFKSLPNSALDLITEPLSLFFFMLWRTTALFLFKRIVDLCKSWFGNAYVPLQSNAPCMLFEYQWLCRWKGSRMLSDFFVITQCSVLFWRKGWGDLRNN